MSGTGSSKAPRLSGPRQDLFPAFLIIILQDKIEKSLKDLQIFQVFSAAPHGLYLLLQDGILIKTVPEE